MIIAVTADGRAELREPDEFRSFKIVMDGQALAALRGALAGIATVEPDGKTAWVACDAVKRLRGPDASTAWLTSFDKMIASVRRFGWANDADGTVRAHVETAPGGPTGPTA